MSSWSASFPLFSIFWFLVSAYPLTLKSPLSLSYLFFLLSSPMSPSSIWPWRETTAQSACGATAGLQTPWTTATTLCPVPFILGKDSCTVSSDVPREVYQHAHALYCIHKLLTCIQTHILHVHPQNYCRNHTFYLLTAQILSFVLPPKSQYSANPCSTDADKAQGCGISAVPLLYTLHYSNKIHSSSSEALMSHCKCRDMVQKSPLCSLMCSICIIAETKYGRCVSSWYSSSCVSFG